jgi:3-oxoacyl-[acyl-carrier protein] reductase
MFSKTQYSLRDRGISVFNLSGHIAFITGAGQGVGAEIARVLAAHGAAVAVNDLFEDRAQQVVDEINAIGGRAVAVPADITDENAVAHAVKKASDELNGCVDILVNNAGIPVTGFSMTNFAQSDRETWGPHIALSVHGLLNVTHAILPAMVDSGWGRVITISSDSARIGEPRLAVYGAAKAFGPALMRTIAKEEGRSGVTANSIALGSIVNPAMGERDPEQLAKQVRPYPVKRLGAPTDIAPAVLWLASNEAAWVTGQTIPVNGGYSTT